MNKQDIQTVLDVLIDVRSIDSGSDIKSAIAILQAALAEPRRYAGKMPPEQEDMDKAALDLAPWLSAALDDPKVCDEYKSAINAWFNAAMPAALAEPSVPEGHHCTAWGSCTFCQECGMEMTPSTEVQLIPNRSEPLSDAGPTVRLTQP